MYCACSPLRGPESRKNPSICVNNISDLFFPNPIYELKITWKKKL